MRCSQKGYFKTTIKLIPVLFEHLLEYTCVRYIKMELEMQHKKMGFQKQWGRGEKKSHLLSTAARWKVKITGVF